LIKTTEYHFEGQVWKIIFDQIDLILAVESRNTETFKVLVDCIDLVKEIKTNLNHELSWWCNLAATNEQKLLFYEFNQKEYANHQSVFTIDLKSNLKLWEFQNLQFQGSKNNIVTLSKTDENFNTTFFNIDFVTGKETTELPRKDKNYSEIPHIYRSEDEYFGTLSHFILLKTDNIAVDQIQFLDCGHFLAISYYFCFNENHKIQILIIFDKEGNEISKINISENRQGIDNGSFFVINQKYIVSTINQNKVLIQEFNI